MTVVHLLAEYGKVPRPSKSAVTELCCLGGKGIKAHLGRVQKAHSIITGTAHHLLQITNTVSYHLCQIELVWVKGTLKVMFESLLFQEVRQIQISISFNGRYKLI